MKATFFLPLLALAARVAIAAQPPACLLNAVNTQDNPADMGAVCGDSAKDVQSAIASMCSGDSASAAQSAFVDTCSSAGKSVASFTASGSSSNSTISTRSGTYVYTTAVYDSSCSCTKTVVSSATGAVTSNSAVTTGASSSSSRTTSSGATVSTAGAVHAQQKIGGYAAAAIALVGAVAAL